PPPPPRTEGRAGPPPSRAGAAAERRPRLWGAGRRPAAHERGRAGGAPGEERRDDGAGDWGRPRPLQPRAGRSRHDPARTARQADPADGTERADAVPLLAQRWPGTAPAGGSAGMEAAGGR